MIKDIKYLRLVLIALLVFLPFCEEDDSGNNSSPSSSSPSWLISQGEVQDGGPGKDGIPAINVPRFVSLAENTLLADQDLVIGVQVDGETWVFPHPILDQHEIVNHTTGGTSYSLTYCPLTGSGIAWDTTDDTGNKTFGVSGLLYNSNLIAYDRATGSNWSQMLMQCVNGQRIGEKAQTIPVVETTWGTWKKLYPQSRVMGDDQGFSNRNYLVYPYGNYRTNESLIFPVNLEDNRLSRKERIHGIIVESRTIAYPIRQFNSPLEVINETFNGVDIVVAGSSTDNFAVSFERKQPDGTVLTFQPISGEYPVVMVDNEGTKWDVFGDGVSGNRHGERLTSTLSFNAYWFAWAAFYPDPEIRGQVSRPSFSSLGGRAFDRMDGDLAFAVGAYDRSEIIRRLAAEWPHWLRESRWTFHRTEEQTRGIHLVESLDGGLLEEFGIAAGDTILDVNGVKINGLRDLLSLRKLLEHELRFEISLDRVGRVLKRVVLLY